MPVIPKINYGAPVQRLALHDVTGPGRLAGAQVKAADAANKVARINQEVVAANNRVIQYDLQAKAVRITSASNVKIAALDNKLKDIEQGMELVNTVAKIYSTIDTQIADQQVRDATLLYQEQLGKTQVGLSAPYRSELVNPDKPGLGYKSVSNSDTLVDRTDEVMQMAAADAMSGVTNGRARAQLEAQFGTSRVKAVAAAHSQAEAWRVDDHRINLGVSIDKAIKSGNLGAAETFRQDGIKTGLITAKEAYDYEVTIDQAKSVKVFSDKTTNLFDSPTPFADAEQLQKVYADPFSNLNAGQRAAMTAQLDTQVGDYWRGRAIGILNTPEAKSSPQLALDRIQSLAQEVLDMPSGADGFATEKEKLAMHKSIVTAGSNIKTIMNEKKAKKAEVRAEIKRKKVSATTEAAEYYAGVLETEYGILIGKLEDGDWNKAEVNGRMYLDGMLGRAKTLFPDSEHPLTEAKKLVGDLKALLVAPGQLAEAADKLETETMQDKDQSIKDWWVANFQQVRREYGSDALATWERRDQMLAVYDDMTQEETGLSSPPVRETLRKGLVVMMNEGKAQVTAQRKHDLIAGTASMFQMGQARYSGTGASADEKTSFNMGFANIGQMEAEPAQIAVAEAGYIAFHGAVPDAYLRRIENGLISSAPGDLLSSVTQVMGLKQIPGYRGDVAFKKVRSNLSPDGKRMLDYGVESAMYGGDLSEKGVLQFRDDLLKQDQSVRDGRLAAFREIQNNVEDGVPAWHGTLATLLDEQGIDPDIMLDPKNAAARHEFHKLFEQEAEFTRFQNVAARSALARWQERFVASNLTGEWSLQSEGPESRVADGVATPPWLLGEFNIALKAANLYGNMEGAKAHYAEFMVPDPADPGRGRDRMFVKGTIWTDENDVPVMIPSGELEGTRFFFQDPVYETTKAFRAEQADIKKARADHVMEAGQKALINLVQGNMDVDPLANAISAATDGNPDPITSRATARQIAYTFTDALEFSIRDPGFHAPVDDTEMYWAKYQVRQYLNKAVEKGMRPEVAETEFKLIMDYVYEIAKEKRAAIYRAKKRDVELESVFKRIPNLDAGKLSRPTISNGQ